MLGIHTRTRRFPLQKQQHGLKTTSSVANAVEEIGKQTTIGMVEPSLIGVPSLPVAAIKPNLQRHHGSVEHARKNLSQMCGSWLATERPLRTMVGKQASSIKNKQPLWEALWKVIIKKTTKTRIDQNLIGFKRILLKSSFFRVSAKQFLRCWKF